ncbi:nuclear transport factor 2 family protein [Flavobacteriaceae bacterium S0825]|uniref:nuclear transport factor 2 family protein n=1 Tax=Gaetbulibacter sp. S0825 TaxID=2720084 RepID=UPI001FCB4EA4|nr:nuclear transport factor 2 family protein [Gaetbulibacter sp. S0825]MCK0107877.1 nuclear transport factor 2 family protein [Flavobacteriaceae bacterium S0825]
MSHKDSLNTILDKYYELNLKVFQSGSTIKDIDNIFNLFTDDFTYVHPKCGGVYTRENLYNGYKRNQEKGSYNGKTVDIKVTSKIIGLNAIAVTKRFIRKEDGKTVEGKEQMAVFEFKDGKIIKIKEYW